MKYFSINPDDPVGIYWVLATAANDGPVLLRPELHAMRCPNCGKIDEEAALRRCLPTDLRIDSKRDLHRDVLSTADDFVLVSRHFTEVMEKEGLSGARLHQLPNESRFMLFVPERVAGRFELSGLEAKSPQPDSWYGGWWTEATRGSESPDRDMLRQLLRRKGAREFIQTVLK